MADNIAAVQLQSFVRRIENVESEISELNSDKSEIYKEARSEGFDVKIIRQVVKDRAKDGAERDEMQALYELYWNAVHGIEPEPVRAHVENIEEFDAETGEITEPQEPEGATSPVQAGAKSVSSPSVENEGAAISTPIQPGTANTVPSIEGVNAPMMVAADANAGGENVADHHSVDTLEKTDFVDDLPRAGALASSSDVETVAPSNITTIRPIKTMRPHCLKPEACGGQGRNHCWSCTKAMTPSGEVA